MTFDIFNLFRINKTMKYNDIKIYLGGGLQKSH